MSFSDLPKSPQRLQNSYILSVIFQYLKSTESFWFFSVKIIRLGDQLLQMKFFENFDFKSFLKTRPIFFGSIHNFGTTDDEML